MNTRRVRFLLLLALTGTTVLFIAYRARQVQAEQIGPFGRYNVRQVLQMTEPLCRALAPQEDVLRFSLDRDIALASDGTFHRQWGVECTDKAGNNVFDFDWDADTGQLLRVIRFKRLPQSDRWKIQNRQEAVQASWDWLQTLGMADNPLQWRCASPPQLSEEIGIVHWQTKGRAVSVQIDPHSGALLAAIQTVQDHSGP